MFGVILVLLAGIAVGSVFRRARWTAWAARMVQPVVGLLLFLMGLAVGSERELVRRLPELGAQALLFSILGLLGSACAAAWVYKRFFRGGKGGAS